MMMNINTPIQTYLMKHPDASLKEYLEHLKTEDQANRDSERLRREQYEAWFDNAVGKYFKLNFNGQSRMVFQLKRNKQFGRDEFSVTAYEILDTGKELKLEIEKNRIINYLWLPNPYDTTYKNSQMGIAEEITEDEYNMIVDMFSDFNEKINKFKSLWT